jgi:hypothetical protein
MKGILYLCSFLFLMVSCKSTITIPVTNHWPYCGGKLPDSTEINGRNEGFSYHSFRVTEGNKTKLIRTDEFGLWKGRLDVTKEITIMDIDKTFSLEELKSAYPLPTSSSSNDQPLYAYVTPEEWLSRCSLDYVSIGALCSEENIARNGNIDTLHVVINRTCFTGTNPIIKYIGPKPR